MLSVTLGVSAEVLHSVLSGGNTVDNGLVSIFQCFLGIASIIIFIAMKRLGNDLSSPTIKAELLGWKLDIAYSLGMSFAFFMSLYFGKNTVLLPISIFRSDCSYNYHDIYASRKH